MKTHRLLLIGLIILIALTGCTQTTSDQQIADRYIQGIDNVSSYEYTYRSDISLKADQTSVNTNITGNGEFDRETRRYHINQTIHQRASYQGTATRLTAGEQRYMVDNTEYVRTNLSYPGHESGWTKIDRTNEADEYWGERDLLELQRTLINESNEINVTEKNDSTVIEVEPSNVESIEAIMSQIPGASYFLLTSGNSSLEDAEIHNISAEIWFESSTNQPLNQSSEINISINHPTLSGIDIQLTNHVEFTEINQEIEIELPEEAHNASELSPENETQE